MAGREVAGDQARGLSRAHSASPASERSPSLPTGRVTFLLTDIVRHVQQWQEAGPAFLDALLKIHHPLLRQEFEKYGGHAFKEMGDGFFVAFSDAGQALECAIAAQQALAAHPWPETVGPIRVRMVLHTAEVEPGEGDYYDPQLGYADRISKAGHGGQILCSEETARLLLQEPAAGVRLADLGLYHLRASALPWRLFQVSYPGMPPEEFPDLNLARYFPRSLPPRSPGFVGREAVIERLCALLPPGDEERRAPSPLPRLATLTGPGGIGKTRLAQEVAHRLCPAFKDAVWFVALDSLPDASLIVDRVLETLGLPRSPGLAPLEQVIEALSYQPSLLVLDNFEHLVEEGALLVRDLLARVPALTVLVTSRRRLGLASELEIPVEPLPAPQGPESPERLLRWESVRLFVVRARRARSGFRVTERNAGAAATLCEQLEGVPLALELAAARAGVLTPAQMVHQLSHRLDLLVTQQPDVDPRHRSMRAALDWSYQLLLPPEVRRFFARLSVFRGGWTLAASEAVCGAADGSWEAGVRGPAASPSYSPDWRPPERPALALEYLEQLCASSLVQAEEPSVVHLSSTFEPREGGDWSHRSGREEVSPPTYSGDTEMRFRMLETVRAYAEEQLLPEERATLAYRHAAYYLSLAERAEPELTGEAQAEWLARLEPELDNVRAVLDWAVAPAEKRGYAAEPVAGPTPAELGLRLAGALPAFWHRRYYRKEDYSTLLRLLALEETRARTEARAKALQALGHHASWLGDNRRARSLLEEALSIRRELGEPGALASALAALGKMAFAEGDYEAARSLLMDSLTISRELQDGPGTSDALNYMGLVTRTQGDLAGARLLWEESLEIRRRLGDRLGIAGCLDSLGVVAQEEGRMDRARSLHEQSLAIRLDLGDRWGLPGARCRLGQMCYLQGDLEAARRHFEEGLAVWEELDNSTGVAWALNSLGLIADRQGRYEQARLLLEQSLAMRRQLGDGWGIAVSLNSLGQTARHQNDGERAVALCRESLMLFRKQGNKLGMVQCLETIAAALLAPVVARTGADGSGAVAAAAELLGAAEAARAALGTPLPPVDRPEYDRTVAAARAALPEVAFAAAWAEGRAMELDQAVAYALEAAL